jgi:hypothetical protein
MVVSDRGLLQPKLLLLTALVAVACISSPAVAETRVALVIGNAAYKNAATLQNPRNDASDVADALRRIGFETIVGLDLDKAGMEEKEISFARAVRDADVGIVYYSGHAMQFGGTNYLMPVDASLRDEADMRRLVRVDDIVADLKQAKNLRILVLDSCRDNPLAEELSRSIEASRGFTVDRGLARIIPPSGMIISYATQAGRTAADGRGRNSPYTMAFLKNIETKDEIGAIFRHITADVYTATQSKQLPELSLSLIGDYYLNGGPQIEAVASLGGPSAPVPDDQTGVEVAFWNSIKNDKNPQLFEAYLKRYPNGAFSDIAKITLQELKTAALNSAATQADDKIEISDPALFKEVRERLYELNFDPGPFEGPYTEAAREAIREFEQQNHLAQTGIATMGLLRRLREVGGLKPWGAIVYAPSDEKWGMSWDAATRKDAVASARTKCGSAKCTTEVSFFGTECGAFAHSGGVWAIVARDNVERAKETALTDCHKRGKACRIVAAICADGADRTTSAE